MSIVGTFAVMYLLGYSLDNLSLMALTLSVGFVVDDAIVMLENIVRHMEMGEGALQAALDGSQEIGFTILSMTLSLAAVFIPVLFMGGILGRLLHEFAVTIGVAILVSGFVSLTLTPMLCSRFLQAARHEAHHGRLYRAVGARLRRHAATSTTGPCSGVLRHRFATMRVASSLLVGHRLPVHGHAQGLPPQPRTPGRSSASPRRPQDISFERMVRAPASMRSRSSRQNPNVEAFMSASAPAEPTWPATRAASSSASSPAVGATARRTRSSRSCGPKLAADPGHPGLPAESAPHPHRRHADQEPVPVHPAGPGHRSSTGCARSSRRRCATCPACRT